MSKVFDAISQNPNAAFIRRCTSPRDSCVNEHGDPTPTRCGWSLFDEVILLVDLESKSIDGSNEVLRISGLACRSCGALQPDGIPSELIEKLTDLEICNH